MVHYRNPRTNGGSYTVDYRAQGALYTEVLLEYNFCVYRDLVQL